MLTCGKNLSGIFRICFEVRGERETAGELNWFCSAAKFLAPKMGQKHRWRSVVLEIRFLSADNDSTHSPIHSRSQSALTKNSFSIQLYIRSHERISEKIICVGRWNSRSVCVSSLNWLNVRYRRERNWVPACGWMQWLSVIRNSTFN